MTGGEMRAELVAPCGMNCALCSAYLSHHLPERKGKPKCAGCRPRDKMCAYIKKNCGPLKKGEYKFCFECAAFPCDRLKKLDLRYRTRYHTGFIDNLHEIKMGGMPAFLESQRQKHTCPACGGVVCVHDDRCYTCGEVSNPPARPGSA